jgi:hypothetical protein
MTTATWRNEIRIPRWIFDDRGISVLCKRCRNAGDEERASRGDICREHRQWADAADPKHCRCRVADHASRAAGVGGGDNRSKVADADTVLENMLRDRGADKRRGDVVEERRDHKHEDQEHETAGPVIRQRGRHPIGKAARLELAGKEGEADQKQKQVRKQHPFMREMGKEAGEARAFSEAFAQELLDDDGAKTDEGGGERVAVKDRDGRERGTEQQKIGDHGRIVSAGIGGNGHFKLLPVSLPLVSAKGCHGITVGPCGLVSGMRKGWDQDSKMSRGHNGGRLSLRLVPPVNGTSETCRQPRKQRDSPTAPASAEAVPETHRLERSIAASTRAS